VILLGLDSGCKDTKNILNMQIFGDKTRAGLRIWKKSINFARNLHKA